MDENAILKSKDPLIILAEKVEKEGRKYTYKYKNEVKKVIEKENKKLAQAMFEIYGNELYPDANDSVRLTYGTVKGIKNPKTRFYTDLKGLFEHNNKNNPYKLTDNYLNSKGKLELKTPFNFISTVDFTGGSSGSPIINTKGELVGIGFDTNKEGIAHDIMYNENGNGRAVGVHTAGMLELLRKVYGNPYFVGEFVVGNKKDEF